MAVSKLYRTCGQPFLPVIMFNYNICLYNNVSERNGNNICLNTSMELFPCFKPLYVNEEHVKHDVKIKKEH